jgi:trans-aconitate 2-methyltransferase
VSDAPDPVDWDAATYDRVADPQEEWGLEVIGRLQLDGGETALDAGCGSGRVTRHLVERLPEGRVIGVDSAPSMIEHAREALSPFADRVELRVCDLLDLSVDQPVDLVFSNAAFHWILDHDRLFARLYAALRPGGVVEAQCGGEGNVAEWKRAIEASEGDERFASYLRGMRDTHYFASVGDTWSRLERCGFEVDRIWLEDKVVEPRDPRAFVSSVGLSRHLHRLPEELHEQFIDAVLGSLPSPLVLEYVRLNISALRPA